MSTASYREVAAAAARGDDEALTILVRAYHDRVYRFGQRVCRNGVDVDDAVQEAFLAALRRQDVAAHNGALSWLMTSVRNACKRLLRPFLRERRALGEPLEDADDALAPALDPQRALERWELVQAVHAAIAQLPLAYREVVVMRDLEGFSGDETCLALGLEPAAMKTRLHRARQRLREIMGQPSTREGRSDVRE
jgi:RNA polymerase sigma-70 factor (ECF subfamily)